VDIGGMRASTLLVIVVLMFIGAGAASTGGGIKVTTFAVVGWTVWSEVRGEGEPSVFRRRIDEVAIRQALAVIVLSIGTVVTAALVVITLVPVEAFDAIFETVSAFGTVGLSTGVTTLLDGPAQLVLVAVMLAGRVGPTTFAAAFVTRERPRLFQLPKERPIIG
jgi:Trk-type K+ transport system membrane component